jgi:hypothetical protein
LKDFGASPSLDRGSNRHLSRVRNCPIFWGAPVGEDVEHLADGGALPGRG